MQNHEITIRATEHPSAHEAIQHLDVSADDHAILVGRQVPDAHAGRGRADRRGRNRVRVPRRPRRHHHDHPRQ